jgi:putative ABC transport system permease protein
MTLRQIALKNLLRRKTKALFVLTGLVIGVATVVGVIGFGQAMTASINHKLDQYGANILVVPKTEHLALTYGGFALGGVSFEMQEIRQADLSRIQTIKNAANVAATGPILLGAVTIKEQPILLAGVDFSSIAILKPWWKIQGALPGPQDVILGAESARQLGLDLDSRMTVKGHDLKVTGILQPTGSQDDGLIFTHLSTAQAILDKQDRVSMAEVAALCTACPIDEMVAQIAAVLPGAKVMAISQVVKGRMETLSHIKKFSYAVCAVVLLVGSLVVLVTMMGSVVERTKEIGIFRAVGFRKGHVMRIIFTEALIISGVAGALGFLTGSALSWVAMRFFTDLHHMAMPMNWKLATGAIFLAVAMGMGSSAYPAILAARLDPNDALRTI